MKASFRLTILAAMAAVTALTASGCGDPGATSNPKSLPSVAQDKALHKTLPDDIRSKKTLVMVTDATMGPPYGYFGDDNKTIEGVDVDLIRAIGQKLGLQVDVKNVKFDSIIPGLQGGRYDLALTAMLDTPERQKQVRFVDVLQGGSSFLVSADSKIDDFTQADACGKKVGAQTGSVEAEGLSDQSKKCVAEGKEPVDLQQYPETDKGILALKAGRIDAYNGATGLISFINKKDSKFRLAGEPYNQGIQGIALPKDSKLVTPVRKALEALMKDGTYAEIVDNYGMKDLMVEEVTVNLK